MQQQRPAERSTARHKPPMRVTTASAERKGVNLPRPPVQRGRRAGACTAGCGNKAAKSSGAGSQALCFPPTGTRHPRQARAAETGAGRERVCPVAPGSARDAQCSQLASEMSVQAARAAQPWARCLHPAAPHTAPVRPRSLPGARRARGTAVGTGAQSGTTGHRLLLLRPWAETGSVLGAAFGETSDLGPHWEI